MNNNTNMSSGSGDNQGNRAQQYRNKEIQTYHIKIWTIRFYAIFGAIVAFILWVAMFFLPEDADGIFKMLVDISNKINLHNLLFMGLIIDICFILLLTFTFLRKCKFDHWIMDIAKKRIGTDRVYYTPKVLYLTYDRGIKEKDKADFVTELSSKSEDFTYYLGDTYINDDVIEIIAKEKCPIPKKAPFDKSKDIYWNIIPLGDCVNNELQQVTPLGWYLNDLNTNDSFMNTIPSTSYLIAGGTGSGKSVAETSIIGHVSRFSDNFQLVGVDCKQVEFNMFVGVKGVKSVAYYPSTAAQAITAFDNIMMQRFEFMRDQGYNNIYNIPKMDVDYYEWHGEKYQFDEIFECYIDKELSIMTIEDIYKAVEEGKIVKIFGSYVIKGDLIKIKDTFKVKALIFMSDELNQLMNSDDYKAVSTCKDKLGNIARLGRAAGVHLVLACQRAASNTISADLKNNIQICSLLGDFDAGASSLMFDEDISHMSKPEIKGRGYTKSGKALIEYQSYFDKPENLIEFDLTRKEVYNNKIYKKQCEKDSSLPTEWKKPDWFRDELPEGYGKEDKKDENSNDSDDKPKRPSYRDRFGGGDRSRPSRPSPKKEPEFKHEIDDNDIADMFKEKEKGEELKTENTENQNVVNNFAAFREKMMAKKQEDNKKVNEQNETQEIKQEISNEDKEVKNDIKEEEVKEEKTVPKFKINTPVKQEEKPKFHIKSS